MTTAGKLGVGFLGAGWWATANHIPVLKARDDVALLGVCRLGKAELEKVKTTYGFPFATENPRELVRHPGIEAVVIASPPALHYEHAKLALEQGLHVLCEKPLALKGAEAAELVRLAQAKGVRFMVSFGRNYNPFVQTAKRWMEQGRIGTIEYVNCHMAAPMRGVLQGTEVPVAAAGHHPPLFTSDPKTWSDPAVAGGGHGHAQLSNATGMLLWLTGLKPRSVFAVMSAPDSKVDLYEAMTVRFEGGVIGSISGAGTVPSKNYARYQFSLRFFGNEGILMLDMDRARLELRRHDGTFEKLDLDPDAGAYKGEGPPNNFVDWVLGKTTVCHSPAEIGLESVRLLDAAYRSAASGREERAE
jgi:predicted dehydrogenase